jgi:transposase
MSKAQAARLFGVSLSSVKRYSRIARQGGSLTPRKSSGRPPKIDENAEKLLEEDIEERPPAAVSERRRFLEHITGRALSDSTVRRLLKRMGFSRKKDCGGGGARRVREALLEAIGRAISAVSAQDARGLFERCGYGIPVQSLWRTL